MNFKIYYFVKKIVIIHFIILEFIAYFVEVELNIDIGFGWSLLVRLLSIIFLLGGYWVLGALGF